MIYVIKRSGNRQEVRFDAITERIARLAKDLNTTFIDSAEIAKKVVDGLYDGVKTTELDDLAAQVCAAMTTVHPDYAQLAARVAISNLHKETTPSFTEMVKTLHAYIEPRTGKHSPFVSDELLKIVHTHGDRIDAELCHDRDYDIFDYFGIKTLVKTYLMQFNDDTILERPQCLFMRVALGIHGDDLEAAFETYHHLSKKDFIHATPTLLNTGTPKPQMSSCFLLAMNDDSLKGIYKTLADVAFISQYAGGCGINMHNIRAKGTFIAGSRGFANGLVPMIRNFNETARYVDQGGGKRRGAVAIYLEPWHADIESFLDLKKNHGAEELRARDLFYALWVCDLFMQRVEADEDWTLMCPHECPNLHTVHGVAFNKLYEQYEQEGRGKKTIKARDLWFALIDAQTETGVPYMLFKDAANRKSNQKNLGTIRGSNLCTEIIEYSDENETAVCNLASICLNNFVDIEKQEYDFARLHKITKVVCRNLNRVIDRNHYITPEAKYSNLRHRPIGIGVQGLANVFALLKLDFDEPRARELNKLIFETMYHASLEASVALAKKDGAYESFAGSPASKGVLQFDMWSISPESGRYDWDALREEIKKHGLRNSLLITVMPTATTAQILGNNEAAEPFTSNLYVRRVLSGEFIVANKHLINDLIELGIWNDTLRKKLIAERGSVQNIEEIPEAIRRRYRTVWELPQRSIVDMSADRGAFICQSQSLNIHMPNATASKLSALHFYAWKRGLKTGMYYLRNTPAVEAVQFTVDKKTLKKTVSKKEADAPIAVTQTTPASSTSPVSTAPMDLEDNEPMCTSCGS